MSDILKRAQDNYKLDKDYWSDAYEKARDDMFFLSDDPRAQWDYKDYNNRVNTGRPALQIDQLSQFVHQVANDVRMNTPSINVIPAGGGSDIETADIFKGLIRNIEYVSNADEAYDTAVSNSIRCSIGFIRVDHDYVDDISFEQQLLIKRVVNPLACLIDCNSVEADGSDATRGIYIEPISVAAFKRKYPGKEPVSFGEENASTRQYKDDDYINIAEYFEIEEEEKQIGLTIEGEFREYHEGIEYTATRFIKKKKVRRYILSGAEILKETTFPGKYVPIVPVYGEEAWVDGKRQIYSLFRRSKDAQKLYNYWKSLETELLMKQPNAPVMAAEGQVEDYAEDWKNPEKTMVLRYRQTDAGGNPAPKPERLAPPQIPTGIVNAARTLIDDIKATMGLYNASIGAKSNETSGIAIARRKEEGDVATYHFGDNLVRSITQVGRICVCAIPEVYDTPRIIRIIGGEDEPKQIGINGQMAEEQERPFDLTKGIYDVRVLTGASYTTKRQESAEFFTQIMTKYPELMNIMGDLFFKNMDIAGAQAMAERMKKAIDPKFLEENKNEPQVDVEKEQMAIALQQGEQVLAQLQSQITELQQKLDDKDAEIALKIGAEQNKAQIERDKLELEFLKIKNEEQKTLSELEFKKMALDIKNRELDLKAAEMAKQENMRSQELAMQQESGGYPDS